ncbi:cytochrome b [Aurantiacibacter suaedae]|uniref:cytochrome b n=1 Tax=Aurantiacibacter suaedae TaxID=2545755 RepID=UPI0010F76385|nr:cytochrome b [Aurantiacibacter suaedae]
MAGQSIKGFGPVAKSLHWLAALLVGWQMLKFGDRIDDGEHWVGQTLVSWHISIGTLMLVLAVFWILHAFAVRKERPPYDASNALYVKAGHRLIFAALVLLPLTGILRMVGAGYPIEAFGIELYPAGDEIDWAASIGSVHSPLAWVFAALIVGHATMALFHHFVLKDDTLSRMTRLRARD